MTALSPVIDMTLYLVSRCSSSPRLGVFVLDRERPEPPLFAMSKRQCAGTTKAGAPCKSVPLTGSDLCLAHSPEQVRAEKGFGGPENGAVGGAATRKPKLLEVLAAKVEEEADAILKPYFDALKKSMVTTTYEGEVHVSQVEDLAARISAAEKLLDRVHGKPKQATELSGPGGGPIPLGAMADEDLRELAAGLRARRAEQ